MNKSILAIIIIAAVVIIGAVYFLQQPRGLQNSQPSQPPNNTVNTNQGTINITIQNFSFNPAELSVNAGDTVTWTNQDPVQHQIKSDTFNSSPLSQGEKFQFTFTVAGEYNYSCAIHPSMKGKIIVKQAGNNNAVKSLDLSSQGLASIPSYVFNQTNLEELNVSHNSLTGAIQAEIRNLQNLKILNASYNQMTGVPAEIGQLQNLESLDLSYNKLTGLPHELGNLKNLKILNLTGNNYSQQDFDYIHGKLPANTIIIAK